MSIVEPVYATRETVKRALDIKETARADEQIDRLLGSCSRSIDGDLHRVFYPRLATLRWDRIGSSSPTPWRLWLDDKEIASVLSLTSGGVSVPLSSLILYPNDGPPYNRVEVDISSASAFAVGNTYQNAIAISGVFAGCKVLWSPAGELVGTISSSVSTLTITNGEDIGIGDLLRIDEEYLLVNDRSWTDSAQNLQSDLEQSAASVAVAITDGSAFNTDEVILIDSERMLITDVSGDTLTVKRAWDGSTLTTHSGSDVYVSRSLTVTRGAVGSSAGIHLADTLIYRWVPPPLISQRCIGEVLSAIQQERSAYARVVGSGDNAFEARGASLTDLRLLTYTLHGRKSRHRAV